MHAFTHISEQAGDFKLANEQSENGSEDPASVPRNREIG
jgi:hypothetical protein